MSIFFQLSVKSSIKNRVGGIGMKGERVGVISVDDGLLSRLGIPPGLGSLNKSE